MSNDIETNLDYFDHPSDMWESRIKRKELTDSYAEWILQAKKWTGFLTLTFRNDVPIDKAKRDFQNLVRLLNIECFGNNYTRKVKHCYFSYVLATEWQLRDVIHFHAIVDRPVNYERIHRVWNAWAGFGLTQSIKDEFRSVKYISKYVSKGGELDIWFAEKIHTPIFIPKWWKENEKTDGILDWFSS